MRSPLIRPILAGTVFSLLGLAPTLTAAETFTVTLEGPNGGGTATYNWATIPWNIPGEYPGLDDPDDAVTILFREFGGLDGTGTPLVQVDLQGNTYSLGSLTINESGTGETGATFQNGAFNVSSISQVSAGNVTTFAAGTTINSGAAPLVLTQSAGFRSMNFQGTVNGAGGVVASMTDINGTLIFNQAGYNVTGGLTMSGPGNLRFDGFGNGTNKVIDSLTYNGTGELSIDRTTGTTGFTLTVGGAVNVNTSRIRLRSEDADGEFVLNGPVTIDNNGAGVEFATNTQRAVVRINGALNDSGEGDILRFAPHLITSSNSGNFGTIVIGSAVTTNRTSDTDFFTTGIAGDNFRSQGGKLVLNAVSAAGTGLGPGQINVGNGISEGNHLVVAANHGAGLDVDLRPFNVISGDLTGATYATSATAGDELAIGAGDRIFVHGTLGLPTTAVTGGATHYLGIPANTGTFTIGDDGNPATTDDIFKGVAFGATISTTVAGAFSGTVNTFNGSADLPVRVLSQIFGQGGTANFNTTGAVTFNGPGAMILDEPNATGVTRAINLDVINRIGSLESQNNNLVILSDASALGTGQTLNLSYGRADLNNVASVQAGSTVVAGQMGTIALDLTPSSGAFTIGQGGMLLLTSPAQAEGGASFSVTGTNAAIILNGEGAIGPQLAALLPQVDIILGGVFNVDDFDGAGIKLGPGKRLSLARDVDTSALTGGTGLTTTAVAGETVFISATAGRTLDLNDTILLGEADVEIGSADPITTIIAQGNVTRWTAAHSGTVNFDGNATAHNVTVKAGTLSFTGLPTQTTPGTANFSGAFTLDPGAIGFVSDDAAAELNLIDGSFALGGVHVKDGARFEFEFDQQPNGVTVQTPFTFSGSPSPTLGSVNLIVDEEGTTTGANPTLFTFNDLRLLDNAVLALDEQGATTARAHLRLAGAGTLLDNANSEDFELMSVSGIDAAGATDPTGAKTLVLGENTTSADTFNTTLFGTLASNVTVQLRNGALTLPAGATLDGRITFAGRTSTASTLIINAGQTGSGFLAGSGQIDLALGEDVEAQVNELDVADPPNPSLAPLENIVSQRINVLAGETGVLRSNRGAINANDATDVFGTVTFDHVHLGAGSALSLATSNTVAVRANLVLDGDASVSATDGTRSYIGSVSNAAFDNTLTITGANVRIVGQVTAKALVVGGSIAGTLNIHPSNSQTQTVTTANGTATYPLLGGAVTTPSLSLMDALVIALGGVVNVGIDNVGDGSWSLTTGVRLSDNADLNLFAPLIVPPGKRFEGTSTNTIFMDDGSAADLGAVTIQGTLAPGLSTARAGTLSFQDGFVTMADGAKYAFDADAASSDFVSIIGSSSKLIFGGAWTLQLSALGNFDPTGRTFVLFDAATAIAGLGTPTIVNDVPGWDVSGATISINGTNDVVLTGIVPEPASGGLLLGGVAIGAARRWRRRS